MNRIASVMSIYLRKRQWYVMPWSILAASFVINVLISLIAGGQVTIYTGGIASIFVYMLVQCSILVMDSLPFALGFSIRRTDYFLGTAAVIVATSAAFALVLVLLGGVETLTGGWGLHLHYFHLPYLTDGSIFSQFWTYFAAMLLCTMLGFVSASIFARFHAIGLLIYFGIGGIFVSVGSFLATYNSWWPSIFNWLTQWSAAQLGLWLLPVIVVCALGAYLSLRRATA